MSEEAAELEAIAALVADLLAGDPQAVADAALVERAERAIGRAVAAATSATRPDTSELAELAAAADMAPRRALATDLALSVQVARALLD